MEKRGRKQPFSLMRSRIERFAPQSRSTILKTFFDDLMGILRVAKCRRHFFIFIFCYFGCHLPKWTITSHEKTKNKMRISRIKRDSLLPLRQTHDDDVNLFHTGRRRVTDERNQNENTGVLFTFLSCVQNNLPSRPSKLLPLHSRAGQWGNVSSVRPSQLMIFYG
jgi:hypothetical protein